MSILTVGSINLSAQINRADFYVAMSIDTGSGMETPQLIYDIQKLISQYGEFPQRKLCERLIENEIPVLVLPVLSKISWANKSSLRINDNINGGPLFDYPRLETPLLSEVITTSKLVPSSEIYDGSLSYNILFDLSNVTIEKQNEYFILPIVVDGNEQKVLFTFTSQFPIEEDYYDCRAIINLDTPSKDDILTLLKGNISVSYYNDGSNPVIIKFNQLGIDEYLKNIINSYDNSWVSSFSLTSDIDVDDYREEIESFINYLSETECFLDNWFQILNTIERLLTIDDNGNYLYDELGNLPGEVSGEVSAIGISISSRLNQYLDTFKYLLLLRYDNLVHYYNTNSLSGLKVSKLDKYNERVISELTNNSKLFEVHSRVKGPKANEIKIKIERFDYYDNSYVVTISSQEREELYYINTDLSVELNTLGRDFQRIQSIDETSELVSLKIFDYAYYNNGEIVNKIDKRDFPEGETFIPYDEHTDTETGELRVYKLLPNNYDSLEFYLKGAVDEEATFYSRRENIEKFNEYDYYPDFYLEDIFIRKNLWENINENELSKYLDNVYNYCCSKFTQALVNMDREFLERETAQQYPQLRTDYSESRILKFYNTIIIDNEQVCSFYPYIINFINSDYLAIIDENIIGKVTLNEDEFFAGNAILYREARRKLIKARLNFIDCDNINYFYTNIREPLLDPSFILRFCISKLSREIMINQSLLIACPPNKLAANLNTITNSVIRKISLISSLSFTYTLNNHSLDVEFTMTLPKIVNKTYVLNITLNY